MASFDAIKKEGFVLRKTEVGEADAMVTCLGEEGKFSFYAKGIRKPTSKNAPSLTIYGELRVQYKMLEPMLQHKCHIIFRIKKALILL